MAIESEGKPPQEASPTASAPFNLTIALERMDGDAGLLDEVIDIFLEDHLNCLNEIKSTAANRDVAGLQRAMHTVKGAVRNFVALEAAGVAQQAEHLCKEGKLDAAIGMVPTVEKAVLVLAESLRAYRLKQAA